VLDLREGTVFFLARLLWWSGKHKHHGGNVQALSDPDGWPI